MIISLNPTPQWNEFESLMKDTDSLLNRDANKRPQYYSTRNGTALEDDVKEALALCAKGTAFENTIEKISGHHFPDIIAAKYYGVEVKSTKSNNWKSTGNSILESTRLTDVKKIYLTFGKLGGRPIEFRSKPYEKCLYDIGVTHMPRYLINMCLGEGETIFDKIGIPYNQLRKMNNPVTPVSRYYRSKLKTGESLWWANDSSEETVPFTVKLWKNIPPKEKKKYTVYGCANYPEIFGGNYDRYSLWLASQGIVDPHIRDQFSAGGREPMRMSDGKTVLFPGVYRRVKENINYLYHLIVNKDASIPEEDLISDNIEVKKKLNDWIDAVSKKSIMGYEMSKDALLTLFFGSK